MAAPGRTCPDGPLTRNLRYDTETKIDPRGHAPAV